MGQKSDEMVQVELKDSEDPERVWDVRSVGTPHPRTDIKRGWDNNI